MCAARFAFNPRVIERRVATPRCYHFFFTRLPKISPVEKFPEMYDRSNIIADIFCFVREVEFKLTFSNVCHVISLTRRDIFTQQRNMNYL